MKIWRLYDVTIFDPERIAGERIFPIFSPCPYKQKPQYTHDEYITAKN